MTGDRFTAKRKALEGRPIRVIASKEIRDAVRNRWFVLYSVAFAGLALALSYVSMLGAGSFGMAGYGRTAAGLVNLVLLIVPLMALTTGASNLASERERGTLGYILAQPVSRFEVLLGKYLGLGVALLAALALGFGISALVTAWLGGSADPAGFATMVGTTLLLALAMLSVGFLISTLSKRGAPAVGVAIFCWLTLAFLTDLGLMGSAVAFRLHASDLFYLALLNPLQAFKMAALSSFGGSLDVLGPAGVYARQSYGGAVQLIFLATLCAWILIPMVLASVVFTRRGVS